MLSLKWSQVDLKEQKITLYPNDTKNRETRFLFMEGELLGAMSKQKTLGDKNFSNCPYVFFNDAGKKLNDFRYTWDKALKKSGIIDKTIHDFRRTAIRNMMRAGVPERVAKMISGHKTRSVFDIYNIINEDDLKLAAKRVSANSGHNFGANEAIQLKTLSDNEHLEASIH